jgi:hypothetical protein
MSILSDLEELAELAEEQQQQKARIEGQLISAKNRLKSELGYSSITEAEKGVKQLQKKANSLELIIKEKIEEFKEEFEEELQTYL